MRNCLFFATLFIISRFRTYESCFRFCENDSYLENGFSVNGSGTLCLICDRVESSNETQSSLTFYINQTNPLSFNEISIKQMVLNTLGKVVIEDNENEISIVFNDSVLTERIGFSTHLIAISIQLFSDEIKPTIDYNQSLKDVNQFQFRLDLNFSELSFINTEHDIDVDDSDRTLTVDYEPNAVRTWLLYRSSNQSYGIVLNITHLDLDIDFGDYLIVGSERRPKAKYSQMSQIITDRKSKSIYSDSDRIFVQMVTHGSTKRGQSLQMVWSPANKTYALSPSESYITDRVREQSLQICILRHNCEKNLLISLKTYLAQYLNQLIFDGSLKYEEFINGRSILIFDRENRSATGVGNYCSAKLAITRRNDHKIVIFDKHTLSQIVFKDGNNYEIEKMFEISDCDFFEMSYQEIYEIVVYLGIPLIAISFIIYRLRKTRNSLDNKSIGALKGLKRQSETSIQNQYKNINSELNLRDFNQLDSDNEFSVKDLKQRNEELNRQTSYSDQIPIIDFKVHSKKRASILNKNFSETCLQSKGSTAQNINYSI